jgi:hypothetical protein
VIYLLMYSNGFLFKDQMADHKDDIQLAGNLVDFIDIEEQ